MHITHLCIYTATKSDEKKVHVDYFSVYCKCSILLLYAYMWTHWPHLRLSRPATSASSQVSPIFCRSLLTVLIQFARGRTGPLLYAGTSQYNACCDVRLWSIRTTCPIQRSRLCCSLRIFGSSSLNHPWQISSAGGSSCAVGCNQWRCIWRWAHAAPSIDFAITTPSVGSVHGPAVSVSESTASSVTTSLALTSIMCFSMGDEFVSCTTVSNDMKLDTTSDVHAFVARSHLRIVLRQIRDPCCQIPGVDICGQLVDLNRASF